MGETVDLARERRLRAVEDAILAELARGADSERLAAMLAGELPAPDLEGSMGERETQQVAIRMETGLLAKLDELAERMERATPGLRVRRAGAIRVLLSIGIEAWEKQEARRTRRPRP